MSFKIGQNGSYILTTASYHCKDIEAEASFGWGVPRINGSREIGISKVLSMGFRNQLVKFYSGDQVALVNCDSLGCYVVK